MQCRSTVARLVKVAAAFASPKGATIRQLVKELEVSRKSIERDRDFLRDRLGLQINCEIVAAPWTREGIEYRHRVTNAGEVLPMLAMLERLAI
jgi:predicted DNA-binding transcriptional regulator YafY